MEKRLRIKGIGQALPKDIVTNNLLEKLAPSTNADWTRTKLGIHERRVADSKTTVVDLGYQAAVEALEDAGMEHYDIDLIIVNTSSPNKISPSVACQIQDRLGAHGKPAFDINAVCSGFIYGLDLASNLLLGDYGNILLISTETYSNITDYSDRNCVFFGDGAAAVVLSRGAVDNFVSRIGADGRGKEHFQCDVGGKFQMNAKEVYKFGTTVLPREIEKLLRQTNTKKSEILTIIPHQPSIGVLVATADKLEIPTNKLIFNMFKYGNTAGASIPMALYNCLKDVKIATGDKVIFAAIGSGWTFGTALWTVNYK